MIDPEGTQVSDSVYAGSFEAILPEPPEKPEPQTETSNELQAKTSNEPQTEILNKIPKEADFEQNVKIREDKAPIPGIAPS